MKKRSSHYLLRNIKEEKWGETAHGLGWEALYHKDVRSSQFNMLTVIPIEFLNWEHDRVIIAVIFKI